MTAALVGCLTLACVVPVPVSAAENLLINSSFELAVDGGRCVAWEGLSDTSTVARVDSVAASDGHAALHLLLDEKTTVAISQAEYMSLSPGQKYTLSAYVKSRNLHSAENLQLQLINLGWTYGYQTRLPIKDGTEGWHRYSMTFTIPPANQFPYQGHDNTQYKVVIHAENAQGEVWIDAIQLEAATTASAYRTNPSDSKMVRHDTIFESVAGENGDLSSPNDAKYFHVKHPLYQELFSDQPGPGRVMYYGYNDIFGEEVFRPYMKKFAVRYVEKEAHQELLKHPEIVPMTNGWARGGVGDYSTMRMILRHDAHQINPKYFGNHTWVMQQAWQEAFIESAVQLAKQSLDESPGNGWGNTWGLWTGDELFESFGIEVVPQDKRDETIRAIDSEIRENYGFGKYGIPSSQEANEPFARIALGRWVNDRLTQTFKTTYQKVKQINPKLVVLGPDPSGAVPPLDMEAMTPYFDLMCNQSWYGPAPYTQQLATGADTKATVDLSECPVWGLVHHTAALDLDAVREQYSQVFRNGGQGIILLGVEWYDRELGHPKFINPAKWQAMLEIADTVASMPKLKLPQADTAILYASDTYLTLWPAKMSTSEHPQMYSAYASLGPSVGSWFKFVSDRQIDRDQRKLSDYKLLYIPYATYGRQNVLEKIEAYVDGGGIVICADPTAFTWNINGEKLRERWQALTGVTYGSPRTGNLVATTLKHGLLAKTTAFKMNFPSKGMEMKAIVGTNIEPLAKFDDGGLAIAAHAHGKGLVISFAANPFDTRDNNRSVDELVRAIQLASGARVDQDIWRFMLPPFKNVTMPSEPDGVCLTDNHIGYSSGEPKPERNTDIHGEYTIDRQLTGISDAAPANQPIEFAKGHLTNRLAAYAGRKRWGGTNPAALDQWIISWTDTNPLAITFDLKRNCQLNELKLWYSGALPKFTVSASEDGQSWQILSQLNTAQTATSDVLDLAMPLAGAHRYVKLSFSRRDDIKMATELLELEIWGNPQRNN
ncbi:MAG: hypothetical protein IT447_10905 [Phycisphaerales bacterium]|nr:hypothetical protein [Phycisphaerales bacterium]